jgi:predicted ATPase
MNSSCNSLYVDGFDFRKSKFNDAMLNERLLANVIYPNDAIRNSLFDEKFLEISNISELDDFTEGKKEEIEVSPGRKMTVPNARNEVCSFEYEDLIGGNRSSAEYMALCKKYHTIMIKNMVP